MRIVLVGGSPRKGNSEWMIKQLAEYLSEKGCSTEVLLLRQLNILRCAGCLKCEDRKGRCVLKDDMNEILPRLVAAEALVMASPVYFNMISGLMKNFIDRNCPIWTQMKGKPLAGLVVAEEGTGQSVRNLQEYSKICQMRWIGAVSVLAKNPGQAAQDPALKLKLKRLAGKIVKAALPDPGLH
jgi:multimeric flavodoxin WrbA